VSWEERFNTSYDAEHIGGHLEALADEVKRLRLAVERGVELVERLTPLSTTGTTG
jgi:hypothetical protein